MSKRTQAGMHGGKDRKRKGRTAITKPIQPNPTNPMVEQAAYAEVNRGVTAAGNMNKHRGDRRDTNKTYTGSLPHASRGNNARRDTSTRAR